MDSLMQPLLWACAVLLVLGGLVGTVVPALPGVLLVFAGLWLGAWMDGYRHVGMFTLTFLGALAALSLVVDFFAAALGARRVGASPRAVSGAALGSFIGCFFGLPGLVLGPFLGAL